MVRARRGGATPALGPSTVASAYSATGAAWQLGPGRVYDVLADRLVACAPVSLRGQRVLDLGAGTGAASRAIERAGGHPLAVDAAVGMLHSDREARPPACAGDALALPFRRAAVDGVVAAFSLNHLDDPAAGLREASRVTRPGGPILASAYAEDDTHPVKAATEAAAAEFGWVMPSWYGDLKQGPVTHLATVERAAAALEAAGLHGVATNERIELAELTAEDLVEWRLGMAQIAPFVAGLDSAQRGVLVERALDALGDAPPLVRSIILIVATAA